MLYPLPGLLCDILNVRDDYFCVFVELCLEGKHSGMLRSAGSQATPSRARCVVDPPCLALGKTYVHHDGAFLHGELPVTLA